MTRRSVVIIGGGISGLSAAYQLSGGVAGPTGETPRIEVIEAGSRFGGSLATTTFAGRTIDLGADGFLARRPEAVQLAKDLGLESELAPIAASGASIYINGHLDPLPSGMVLGVPTSAASLRGLRGLSRGARWAAWRDEHFPSSWVAGDDTSIGEILRHKLGSELTYQLIEPMIGGIQAGRVDDLSAKSVFPALLKAAQKKGSLMKNIGASGSAVPGPSTAFAESGPAFHSLERGVGSLVSALVATLEARGVVLRCNDPVTALRRSPTSAYAWEVDTQHMCTPANDVILATPAPITGALAGSFAPALDALRSVPTASAAMVTISVPRDSLALPATGTGILVPLNSPFGDDTFLVTAVTFLDRKWTHLKRDGDHLIRLHVGRSDDHRWAALSDDALISRVSNELATILGQSVDHSESLIQRWVDGLPQYVVGHDELVRNAKEAAVSLGLHLCGNAYDGVGVPATIGSGRNVATHVLQSSR